MERQAEITPMSNKSEWTKEKIDRAVRELQTTRQGKSDTILTWQSHWEPEVERRVGTVPRYRPLGKKRQQPTTEQLQRDQLHQGLRKKAERFPGDPNVAPKRSDLQLAAFPTWSLQRFNVDGDVKIPNTS